MLDVGPHGERRGLFAAIEEHRSARDADQRRLNVGELVDELGQRSLGSLPRAGDDLAPTLPGGHHGERRDTDQQRQPCSVDQLGQVRREEHQVDEQQQAGAYQD